MVMWFGLILVASILTFAYIAHLHRKIWELDQTVEDLLHRSSQNANLGRLLKELVEILNREGPDSIKLRGFIAKHSYIDGFADLAQAAIEIKR